MNSTNHALHVYYALRDQQAFQKLLESSKFEQSHSRASNRPTQATSHKIDVNARDALGRTILHLTCSNASPSSLEYVKLLLTHPDINLDLQDHESHWTALHRAGYAGNIAACVLLLKRGADPAIPDLEGLYAFDLYNLTIAGGFPDPLHTFSRKQLLTWGTNRNGVLCHADGADRPLPEQVFIRNEVYSPESSVSNRFGVPGFRSIGMAKLHTVVLTDQTSDNLRVCGFGSGGRLGVFTNSQYKPLPLPSAMPVIKFVALGQDHTLALSGDGVVYSWGLNRFSQLGYPVDPPKPGAEPIQATPRKVQGPLKKEIAAGLAACKTASACWSSDGHLFTWGTNDGQLGYDSVAHAVQVQPRVVSSIDFHVVGVALAEFAMACLSSSGDVVCFSGNGHFRIPFGNPPSSIKLQRQIRPLIRKVLSSDDTLAFVTQLGDVFILNSTELAKDGLKSSFARPRKVWSRTHESSMANDVALGSDGSLLICSKGGQVYTQAKQARLVGRGPKFRRIPYIHRATAIFANAAGCFASLKHEFVPSPVTRETRRFSDDFWQLLRPVVSDAPKHVPRDSEKIEEEIEDQDALRQVFIYQQCLKALLPLSEVSSHTMTLRFNLQASRDEIVLECGKLRLVAHRSLLYARCIELERLTMVRSEGPVTISSRREDQDSPRVVFTGYHPLSVLLFTLYLYTDEVIAIWDSRVRGASQASMIPLSVHQVHKEMQDLSNLLQLAELEAAVRLTSIHIPRPTLSLDMQQIYDMLCRNCDAPSKPFCDVKLTFEDRSLHCASCILQARSPYFAAFFGDQVWTKSRMDSEDLVEIMFPHMKWQSARLAFAHIYYGAQEELFDVVGEIVAKFTTNLTHVQKEHVATIDELIDFVFEVLNVANELLLDDLQIACTNIIIKFLDMHNLVAILAEAAHLGIDVLLNKLYHYIAVNLETLVAYSIMDDIPQGLIVRVGQGIQKLQGDHTPFMRGGGGLRDAVKRNQAWSEQQDFPRPILPNQTGKTRSRLSVAGRANLAQQVAVGIRMEDPPIGNGTLSKEANSERDESLTSPKGSVWKAQSTSISSKTSLRSIMMEAEKDIKRIVEDNPFRGTIRKLSASGRPNEQPRDTDFNSGNQTTPPTTKLPESNRAFPEASSSSRTTLPQVVSPSDRPQRNAGDRPVWNQQVAALPPPSPSRIRGNTFLEIQFEQQKVQESPSRRNKMSIKDIQLEEEAHQQEKEFLKWWAAEEERVRNEQREVEAAALLPVGRDSRQSQGDSKNGGRGRRGRGGERGRGRQRGRRPVEQGQAGSHE